MIEDVLYSARKDEDAINSVLRINFRSPKSCETCTWSKAIVGDTYFGLSQEIVDWRCYRHGISFGKSGDSLDDYVCDDWSDE